MPATLPDFGEVAALPDFGESNLPDFGESLETPKFIPDPNIRPGTEDDIAETREMGNPWAAITRPVANLVPKVSGGTMQRILTLPAQLASDYIEGQPDTVKTPIAEKVMASAPSDKTVAIATGVEHSAADLANFFTSPLGIATLGIGALPKAAQSAIALGFSVQMGKEVPEIARQLGEEIGKPEEERDYQKIAKLTADGISTTGFSAMGGAHAAHPVMEKAGAFPSSPDEIRARTAAPGSQSQPGASTPVPPAETSAQPAQGATAQPITISQDTVKDLIESLTKGQIKVEEKRPETKPVPSVTNPVSEPPEVTPETNAYENLSETPQPAAALPDFTEPSAAEPAEPQSVTPPKPKGNPFWIRPRSDGVPNILDDIQELGGIKPPGPNAGGEYDGYSEARLGPARMLFRRGAYHAPDTLIEELHGMGNHLRVTTPDELWEAISKASDERVNLARNGGGHEAQTNKFWSAVLDPKSKSGLEQINVQDLKLGDTFRIRGPGISHEELTVTHIDPDSGDIQVKDGPKLGRQNIPDGTQLWVQRGSAPKAPRAAAPAPPTLRTGEKGTGDLLQGQDQPFNLAGEKASDGDRIAAEKAKAEATAREAKEIEAKQQAELPTEVESGLEPVPASSIDTPAQGVLNQAREWKQSAWNQVKELRQKVKDAGLGSGNLRLELLKAESNHRDAVRMERDAADAVEKRANELGQTTKSPSIGRGIKAALEKNQGGEGGFVHIPSRQELLDHFTDLGDQLREAAKYISSKKRNLIDRLKRGGDFDTISKLKDAAENMGHLMGKQTGNVVRHELNRAFDVKPERVRKERNDLRESALTFAIEAGGDRSILAQWRYQLTKSEVAPRLWRRRALRAIEFADANWDRLQPVVETYRRITDAENAYENANGIPTLYREGGYVLHAQDLEATYDTGSGNVVTGQAGGAATPFRKGRDYQTYAEAIANGVHPKSLNAVDLLEHRVSIGQRAVNMTDWIDSLQHIQDKATKLPVVVKPEWVERTGNLGPSHPELAGMPPAKATQGYWKVPPRYNLVEFGGVGPDGQPRKIGLHKGFTGLFNSLTEPSWFQKSAGRNAFIEGMGFAKHTALLFDTYHLGRLAFWNAVSRGGLPTYQRGWTLLENTLPELQTMIDRGEMPAKWGQELIRNKQRLDAVMRQGGNLSGVGDNLHTEFLKQVPGLGTFNKWLFDKYQRGAMSEVALMEFDRQAKMNPGEDMETTARRVAKAVNTRFGNLQSQAWLKSKTGQDLARVFFLAPQWNESLIRAELGAVKEFGQAGLNVARGRRPALGMLAKGIGTAVLGTFVANQLINLYTRGYPTWENPEEEAGAKISAWIPDKVGGGPGYLLNPLSLPTEMANLVYRGIDRHRDQSLGTAASMAVLDILKARMSPLTRGVWTWATGETPMGVKVGHGAGSAITEALPTPMSSGAIYRAGKQVVTGEHQEKFPGEFQKQAMQSFGLKTEQAPDSSRRIFNLAKRFESTKGITDKPMQDIPVYADLTAAVKRGNMTDANEALDKILTLAKGSGEPHNLVDVEKYYVQWLKRPFTRNTKLEREFYDTLTPAQKQVYQKARQGRADVAKAIGQLLTERAK